MVHEGRLVEAPSDGQADIYRRAFGEYVGPRGEQASYALGWGPGDVDGVARLTIGIGAGNVGGGTFHAALVPNGDSYYFSLVDDPFAEVPQGGPHLTAAEARVHEDLPFIWAVADTIMERDRRAWWMRHRIVRTDAITTAHVVNGEEPILLVAHDDDNGMWLLMGVTPGTVDNGRVGHLFHSVDDDPTLVEVLDLGPGESAIRTHVGAPWTRTRGLP